MLRVIRHESSNDSGSNAFIHLASAVSLPLEDSSSDCVVTDPPYGNSIAYADLSDFFYVWLKRSLGDFMPQIFATPQTPKATGGLRATNIVTTVLKPKRTTIIRAY